MSVIVRDDGFHAEDFEGSAVIEIASNTGIDALPASFEGVEMIAVGFPAFSDGRGFTLARHLRNRGFGGRLRAKGHVIADQYAMARRAGFDEVEIPDDLAARQPQEQWLFRADWRDHDYRSRLKA
ncbi:MAG: DUF934 domain-containing protein [Rhodobacteraceae bacterium]|jgi:uncharacterized protein (DUF934 family)|nr:DUF934 domain-containing protein [uncultured Defluviimonas sp.]MCB2124097.1 DUF934 domain-containing protein [Paracoccaceae bacterium]MCC0070220.1 DUF934 domain-containing protein [Paracoccaceae bacterium]